MSDLFDKSINYRIIIDETKYPEIMIYSEFHTPCINKLASLRALNVSIYFP